MTERNGDTGPLIRPFTPPAPIPIDPTIPTLPPGIPGGPPPPDVPPPDRVFVPPVLPGQVSDIIRTSQVARPAAAGLPKGIGAVIALVAAGFGIATFRELQEQAELRRQRELEEDERIEREIQRRIARFDQVRTIQIEAEPALEPEIDEIVVLAPPAQPGRAQPILDEPFEFEPIFPVEAPAPAEPVVRPDIPIPTIPAPRPATRPATRPGTQPRPTPSPRPAPTPRTRPRPRVAPRIPFPLPAPFRLPTVRPRVRPRTRTLPDTPRPPRPAAPPVPTPLTFVQPTVVPSAPTQSPPRTQERCRETQRRRRRRNRCNEGFFRELRNGELEKITWRTRNCLTGEVIDPGLAGVLDEIDRQIDRRIIR